VADRLGPAMQSLLDACESALVEGGRRAAHVALAPGNTVSWDNCCDASEGGGQLWARVVSAVPRPQPSQPCDLTHLSVRAAVGAVRCMHGVDEEGYPTPAEMTGDTLGMTADADLLLRGIRAWAPPADQVPPKTLAVEQGLPLGPQGYCGGWEWTVTFGLLL
jgi:hypothetical protein